MAVRFMLAQDVPGAALIHQVAFPRQQYSQQWLQCSFKAAPRTFCLVAEKRGEVVGYIIWAQKSGFRPQVVLELEQLAVEPSYQGQGIGRQLLTDSLPLVKEQLRNQGSTLKHILITTRADNRAQNLYRQALGAEVEATLSDLYSADEVIMIARHVDV